MRYAWVLIIEGYENLLTNHPDTDAVLAAYAGTGALHGWDTAIDGLEVQGAFEQSIRPWSAEIETGSLSFVIHDTDGTDTVGIDMHRGAGGTTSTLASALTATGATVTLTSTTGFPASGTAYIGRETLRYATVAGSTLTSAVRGIYSPFSTDEVTVEAHQFAHPHELPSVEYDVSLRPHVSTVAQTWIGRSVGLYMHRLIGDTLDTKAQAQLCFAGTIVEVNDTSEGLTELVCEDIRGKLNNTTLLNDQWYGKIDDGIYLAPNTYFDCYVHSSTVNEETANGAGRLDIVTGASGDYEIEAGYWEVDLLVSRLQEWLNQASDDGHLDGEFSVALKAEPSSTGVRLVFEWNPSGGTAPFFFRLTAANWVWQSLGWNRDYIGYGDVESNSLTIKSDDEPYRARFVLTTGGEVSFASTRGTWVDNTDYLPSALASATEVEDGEWGVFDVNGTRFLGMYDGAGTFSNVTVSTVLNEGITAEQAQKYQLGIRYSEGGELEAKQVVFLAGDFDVTMLRLLASTGTSGYNHAIYDVFPSQLGCAIPWSLLGDPCILSLNNLAADAGNLVLVLDEPVTFTEALAADLVMRAAFLVWKNGRLIFATPQTPNGALAVHTFTEATKASSAPGDAQRAPTQTTDEYLVNHVKIRFNRDVRSGEYRNVYDLRFQRSIEEYGSAKPLTIEARNSYSINGDSSITDMTALLVGNLLPLFGRPLKRLQLPISFAHYESVAPGDLCTVSDSFARDSATGRRGISVKPGLILSTSHDWGRSNQDMVGHVEVLFLDFDNAAVYSPTAEVDNTASNGGYNSGTSTLTCKAHAHSETNAVADASHFAADDTIRIFEIDPTTGSTSLNWTRTVASVSGNDIALTAAISSPAWDSSKRYRIVSQAYTSATETQKTDAYQADDADYLVQDTRIPYEYSQSAPVNTWTGTAPTLLHERPSSIQYGDGVPMSTATHRAPVRSANNLVSFKTAPQLPTALQGSITGSAGNTAWLMHESRPVFLGPGDLAAKQRYLRIGIGLRSSTGGDEVAGRVTVSLLPPSGDSRVNVDHGPSYVQKTFTTTSGTLHHVAPQDFPIAGLYWKSLGWAWVTVESQGSGAHGSTPIYYGINECRLGPLEPRILDVPTDGPRNQYIPADAADWYDLDLPAPNHGWTFQESSGNFTDSFDGTGTLTAAAGVSYGQPGPEGWDDSFISWAQNTGGAKLPDGIYDATATVVAVLLYVSLTDASSNNRQIINVNGNNVSGGGAQVITLSNAGTLRALSNGTGTDTTNTYVDDGLVHPLLVYFDPTTLDMTLSTDLEQITQAGTLCTNSNLKGFGNTNASTDAPMTIRAAWWWRGANATAIASIANAKTTLQTLRWEVSGY